MIKTACKNVEKYKSNDYFKKSYEHDAEHDDAKYVTILMIFMSIRSVFSKDMF